MVDGQEAITIEHVDRMAADVAPDWPKSRAGGIDGVWRVMIEGEPSFDAEFETGFNPYEDSTDHGLLATGMPATTLSRGSATRHQDWLTHCTFTGDAGDRFAPPAPRRHPDDRRSPRCPDRSLDALVMQSP